MNDLRNSIGGSLQGQDPVKVHSPEDDSTWADVKKAADRNRQAHKHCEPIVLIGYSDGATRVRLTAMSLALMYPGEKIDYVGIIDMTRSNLNITLPGQQDATGLPDNILDGDNFYQRNGPKHLWYLFGGSLTGMSVASPATVRNHLWNTLTSGNKSDHFTIVRDTEILSTISDNATKAWNKAKVTPHEESP
jgi:hypothetical protein